MRPLISFLLIARALVILLVVLSLTGSRAGFVRDEDICGPHNGRRLYLELGERGVLRANNISLSKGGRDSSSPFAGNSSHDQCSLELVTCPSCIVALTFKSINLLHHCGDGGMTVDSPCRCDYVWISEPPYEDVSGTPFCGHYAPITYRSNTRTLSIVLLYSQSHGHAFTIEYTAERNRLLLKGSKLVSELSKAMNITSGGALTSPFFPSRYPRDLGMEYIISCPAKVPSCRVQILFSDFQLAPVSIIEFYDWNGQRLDVSSGARFRPPIIVSTGPSLLIRFYANGGTGLGYKAFYSFVIGQEYESRGQPTTDCGGYVEDLGGAITMMDMVDEGIKTYDCIWLIRPPKSFIHMRTHMYLKVIAFAEMAGTTELTIKQGPTSALMPLEVLRHPVSQVHPPKLKEHVVPVSSGFHVSLRGTFGPNSQLSIAYAAFSYMDCFTGTDFLCQNHRCIPVSLNCDGFDHCGDNSDEPATCLHEWDVDVHDRKWQLSKANYYFPKVDQYPDLKTATLVFVASSLGLILLISALIVLLYRVGARARQQRELQTRLRTISELLDGSRIDEITVTDDPPVYEAPPNYDEVIKLGIEEENEPTGRRRRFKTLRASRRSRSLSSSQCSYDYQPEMTLNVHEDESNENRSSQAMSSRSDSVKNPVPESPPPPYVTPTDTILGQFDYSFVLNLPGPSQPSSAQSEDLGEGESASRREPDGSVGSAGNCTAGLLSLIAGNRGDVQPRRSWLRRSGSYFRSLPSSRAASVSPPGSPSSETLGAYVPIPTTRLSNFLVTQRGNSISACASTRSECASAPGQDVDGPAADVDGTDLPSILVCSCDGACGCVAASLRSSNNNNNSAYAKVSSSSPYGSPDELGEDFEVVSETTSILEPNTLPSTPVAPPRRHSASFDLRSLYESIKTLDRFLAQRGIVYGNGGLGTARRRMAIMIFGTPRHNLHSKSQDALLSPNTESRGFGAARIRIWQSTDDTFSS